MLQIKYFLTILNFPVQLSLYKEVLMFTCIRNTQCMVKNLTRIVLIIIIHIILNNLKNTV